MGQHRLGTRPPRRRRGGRVPDGLRPQDVLPPRRPPEIVLDDRDEADIAFSHPCDITAWPSVPTRVVAAESDRFFPAPFQARLARERVGVEAEYVPGGHLNALSHPAELVDYLVTSAR
ncbi:alpha/beta fold hydrolase [Actinokineospora soli]|uniref:Alpha/beta fold hydrolase n=1 Tax=Actinokineospora soli TaxID=1048753 RepID=A0ABW2TUT1_9PSEU